MPATSENKRITITGKRQLTIPQKYFEALGFESEAECILRDDGVLIRPLHSSVSDFSEVVLADLVSQGLTGQELLEGFREQTRKLRPAVELLIAEADEMARSGTGRCSFAELFGPALD